MQVIGRSGTSKAFALPTVLIASIVLLTVLAVSVTATAAVRTTLKNQYYIQLAQVAGESGVAYAKACLAANGNIPQWTDAKPLTPATDCSGNVTLSHSVRALIVAGGGSGGGSTGGGGGAGGLIYNDTVGINATAYPVVVGAGGAIPGNMGHGLSGANSSFNGLVAIGGGGGGYSANSSSGAGGYNGGSGGGGQDYYGSYAPGTATAGQGNNGAPGGSASAGGGGGAGGPGTTSASTNIGGNGGPGVQNNITGAMVYYAAGGGGGNGGVAGTGGNQTPGPSNGQAPSASPNTGNGGTGGWAYADGNGGTGGSGIVILAFPVDSGIVATGGTVTNSGGYEIHTFTSSGTFNVTSTGNASCPSDPSCSVTVNGNVRSSFAVPKPTVDPATGQALTIPNSGYVDVLRTSNGAVWRTYKQPSVQAAVVPDLCSGNATAARGWTAAVTTTQQDALPSASTAQTISLANAAVNAGVMYFRKDFNISEPASYDLNVYTSSSQDVAATYIDGQLISSTAGALSTSSVSLTSGCHVMVTELTNATVVPRASDFTASLTRSGEATPVVVTNTSWRVTTGDPVHFSTNNYFEAPNSWAPVADRGIWNDPAVSWSSQTASWANVSGDPYAQFISTQVYSNGTVAPNSSSALFRQTVPFTLNNADTVRITTFCDDTCNLYLDGNQITSGSYSVTSKSITIQPGTHTFGMRVNNTGSAANASGFLFSANDLTSGTIVARSGVDWDSTNFWTTTGVDSYSYDASYTPVPAVQPMSNIQLLLVAGGGSGGTSTGGSGGGGGGGAGGALYNAAYSIGAGTYPVVVGAGGAAVSAASTIGNMGQNSQFNDLVAFGGGGGGASNGRSFMGGSGGGGGYLGYTLQTGSPGVGGQGNNGGSTLSNNNGGGGGGAGGAGGNTNSGGPSGTGGTGGPGLAYSISGASVTYARGGDGGAPPGGFYNGAANTGNGGSGVYATAPSGAGGSGVVIIAYPTGTLTATGGSITTSGGFTIHRFTSSGTFIVTSVNS
jgi:hypothetical protein